MERKYIYRESGLPELICRDHPEWVEAYNTAWRLAFNNIEYPEKPGWKPQMSCMPGSGKIWQWDSCLMSLFGRYSNNTIPVMNNLDNLYRLQAPSGYMSMAYRIDTESPAFGARINPPLFAWVEWEYYLLTGDDSRFEYVFPKLQKYFDWIKTNRTRSSGLYWFEDSASSGMDNSPRGGYRALHQDGSDVCFVDLACQQALSALHLGNIAGHLGNKDARERFCEEHAELAALINDMHWSEKHGIYFDLFARHEKAYRHNFVNHKTVAAFWPILSGVADALQVKRLLEHLNDPEEFHTPHPVPSLSRDDPNYDPLGGYWLGGVWAPTNYMVVKGLAQSGHGDAARGIAVRHLEAIITVMRDNNYASIWECYSPEYIRPANKVSPDDLVRKDFVGWSGLGPVAMLIENILGLSFNADENLIDWALCTRGRHGIKNLSFNGRKVSLICSDSGTRTKKKIFVETDGGINLNLRLQGAGRRVHLESGRHELDM